jgi:lipopolysaccharide transport system permease protein
VSAPLTAASASSALPVHEIAPARWFVPVRLGEIWDYRELLYLLAWRDIRIRYKQTALGVAWAILQPLITMAVFTLFFGRLAGLPSDGFPYPLFTFCGLLPWQLFAFALTESTVSVVHHQRLITKVYFPRLIIPLAAVAVGLADFLCTFIVLCVMLAYYGIVPGWAVLTLPIWVMLALASALSVGFWFSALNVRYRDIRYTLPFLTQIWLFATPVAYSSSLIPSDWRALAALNPMVGVVDGFRWALLGTATFPGPTVLMSSAAVLMLLVTGAFYFRSVERTFADII